MTVDLEAVSRIIREVAAEEVLPRFRKLAGHEIKEKSGPADLVTIADVEAEKALHRRLSALEPDAVVVGEEAADGQPELLAHLANDQPAWIIDPVDGTFNFSEGKDTFGMIVAYVRGGQTVAGWIHAPVSGEMAVAERGGGAWLHGTDGSRAPLAVAQAADLETMVGALYAGARRAPEIHEQVKRIRHRLGGRSYSRCVAYEYLALAQARHHFALFTRLMPWDHAAGILLHGEAGGYNALLDGRAYAPSVREGTMLLAPDAESWHMLKRLLQPEAKY